MTSDCNTKEVMTVSENGAIDVQIIIGEAFLSKSEEARRRAIALYEAYRAAIYLFLLGQGLRPVIAQEITQDVFVDLFVALEKGTKINSEQAWLYTVAARAAVDYWRREGRAMWVELDSDGTMAGAAHSSEANPEAHAGYRERLAKVAAGLLRLPKEQRLCIHLRMQGLRYREIATVLRVSTSTAAEWLASAIETLRKETHG
jgi:RNA polymerase sigma-70 factor (ECF subfamily)